MKKSTKIILIVAAVVIIGSAAFYWGYYLPKKKVKTPVKTPAQAAVESPKVKSTAAAATE